MFTGPLALSRTDLFPGDSIEVTFKTQRYMYIAPCHIIITGVFVEQDRIKEFLALEEYDDLKAIWPLDNGPDPGV